jgi:hypothetical protein
MWKHKIHPDLKPFAECPYGDCGPGMLPNQHFHTHTDFEFEEEWPNEIDIKEHEELKAIEKPEKQR